jgi:hypothetical protein
VNAAASFIGAVPLAQIVVLVPLDIAYTGRVHGMDVAIVAEVVDVLPAAHG